MNATASQNKSAKEERNLLIHMPTEIAEDHGHWHEADSEQSDDVAENGVAAPRDTLPRGVGLVAKVVRVQQPQQKHVSERGASRVQNQSGQTQQEDAVGLKLGAVMIENLVCAAAKGRSAAREAQGTNHRSISRARGTGNESSVTKRQGMTAGSANSRSAE
jgi:hypothetical protein